MNNPALTLTALLKTRTAQAALAGVALHVASAASAKLGFSVDAGDVLNGLGAILDLAAMYFRGQAPVRDAQDVVTARP
jgi:hypothetical protein